MNIRFDGKVALVTDAASGIGLATAIAFAQSGASVVLADLDMPVSDAEVQKLVDAGYRAVAVRCDVARETDAADAVARCIATFGSLNMAFNNAGLHVLIENTADSLARISI